MDVSNPANVNFLYEFLVAQPEWTSHENRKVLSRRLREQMLKQWVVIGIPRVITAVRALATIEAPEDADFSFTKEDVTTSPEIRTRGRDLCHAIYGEDRFEDIMASWGSMRADITWTADNIIYGMFLSDERVLNCQETTLMSYSCMACMGLLGTSRRHLVGLLKNGASEEECKAVIECVKLLAEWARVETSNFLTLTDLVNEPKGKEMHDQIKVGRI
ncbi:hypothetical protein N7495_004718 [Penicillium taxi]|uniref:uncharacterized protein n=1 Tax=Penicillium taxi TaxID=168475 RepID=UPI0025458AD4|nr:uncharacterized protein N7495_004718 [Penicillium taxi]KAJ5899974.1 hypothetical protein N7495_004718 [Penicillium taxi]